MNTGYAELAMQHIGEKYIDMLLRQRTWPGPKGVTVRISRPGGGPEFLFRRWTQGGVKATSTLVLVAEYPGCRKHVAISYQFPAMSLDATRVEVADAVAKGFDKAMDLMQRRLKRVPWASHVLGRRRQGRRGK